MSRQPTSPSPSPAPAQAPDAMRAPVLDALDRRLLDDFQQGFPLSPRPYRDIAEQLGIGEAEVLARLESLSRAGIVSRVGPVVRPGRAGVSTLGAMRVAPERLEAVAALVSAYPEVNHNYEREHAFNLWFVLTAADADRLGAVLDEIALRTGIPVMDLPMLEEYHIDLGFRLQWP
jgi:DNA-binding Lrp family transcriptional regulator